MPHELYTDGDYLKSNPNWHESDSPWKAQQIAKILRRNSLDPQRVCEIGCGAGAVLAQLQSIMATKAEYVGYDITKDAFELCQGKENERLHFHYADLLTTETEVFDVVLVIDVVEHVEDCFGFLRRLHGKGKNFIFHFPLDMSAQMILRRKPIMKLRYQVGHVHSFMKETVLALLAETGYQVQDHFYTATDLELPAQSWKASMAKVPRRLFFGMQPDLAVRCLGGWSLMVLAK